jgi:hypothetical protein
LRGPTVRLAVAIAVLASAIGASAAFAGKQPDPEISGTPREGETLFASVSGGPPDNWQWERCSASMVEDCDPPKRGQFWTQISGADEDTYTLTSADVGDFIRVVAYDDFSNCQRGIFYCNPRFSDPVGPIEPALAQPPPSGGPPPPVAHVSANLTPLQGTILVKLPGSDFFIPLTETTQVPLGTVVDARSGHVLVTTARNEQGAIQSSEFWAGVFKVTQTESGPLVTVLALVGPGEPAGRAQARARGGGRRLWGRGRCKCRTNGRHSSATVRGTWWFTSDRPNRTLTKVKRGTVRVRDFALEKTFTVRAGERYIARKRSR